MMEYVLVWDNMVIMITMAYYAKWDTYYKATITQIGTITDKPIVVRSHPGFKGGLREHMIRIIIKNKILQDIPKQIQQTYDKKILI